MEGKFYRQFLIALTTFNIFSLSISAQSLEDVNDALKLSYQLKNRILDGRSPCFTEQCQNEKSILLHEIQKQSQFLGYLNSELNDLAAKAVHSARLGLSKNRVYPFEQMREPKNLREWMDFYERRFSNDYDAEMNWISFANQIKLMRIVPRTINQLNRKLSEEDKIYFQEVWDRGYAKTISLYRRAHYLGIEKSKAYANNDPARVVELEQKIYQLHDEARNWLIENQINLRQFESRIFSGLSSERVREICLFLDLWMQIIPTQEIFDFQFLERINRFNDVLHELQNLNRAYSDREHGVVGIQNFLSLDNPVVRSAHEQKIQSELESHLGILRGVINQGQYSFSIVLAAALGGSSRLLQFGIYGLGNYFQDVLEFRFSERIIPRSYRLAKLSASQAYWEPRMTKRKQELERSLEVLENKILHLTSLRDRLQMEGKRNEDENQP